MRWTALAFAIGCSAPTPRAPAATSLYFIERGTPDFERYRLRMPARFAQIAARFGP